MDTVYIKEEDGTLRPLKYPPKLVEQVSVYTWLQEQGLCLDEINFLCDGGLTFYLSQDDELHHK